MTKKSLKKALFSRLSKKLIPYSSVKDPDYHIVGSTEADPASLKISNDSPVGRALIGKKAGDMVEVTVPDGIVKLKVLEIYK